MQTENTSNKRRDFLKIFGLGATGLLVNPAKGLGNAKFSKSKPLHIGLLLPEGLGGNSQQWLNGFRLGLQNGGFGESRLSMEDIGKGGRETIVSKSKKLLEEKADIVAGIMNSNTVSSLDQIYQQHKVPLLVNDIGGNLPTQKEANPYVYYNSFNLWEAHFALGKHCAANLGSKCLIATTLYDSGFDIQYAFQLGVESVGGEVTTFVSRDNYSENSVGLFEAKVGEFQPDFVFGNISGRPAASFFVHYNQLGFADSLPLAMNPFGITDSESHFIKEVFTVGSWDQKSNEKVTAGFVKSFQKLHHTSPGAFAVLGYESGLLISQAAAKIAKTGNDDWLAALDDAAPQGIRGSWVMNGKTNTSSFQLDLMKITGGMLLKSAKVCRLENIDETASVFQPFFTELRTGWTNPYLYA